METSKLEQKHFLLVHGACHGAWCWYKLKPLLEAAGHKVTTFDLAASGIDRKEIPHDVQTFPQYTEPLLQILDSLPEDEKVILVGHSLGGINISFAMEEFPGKISVAVFLSGFLPDTVHKRSYVMEQYLDRHSAEHWLDTAFIPFGSNFAFLFGPQFAASKLYQLSHFEDFELAKVLLRPSSFFLGSLGNTVKFSNDKFGSVKKVYVVLKEDLAISEEFQRWMICNGNVKDVLEIDGADHMAMMSKPQAVRDILLQIASEFS